jgi:hypothetical protein
MHASPSALPCWVLREAVSIAVKRAWARVMGGVGRPVRFGSGWSVPLSWSSPTPLMNRFHCRSYRGCHYNICCRCIYMSLSLWSANYTRRHQYSFLHIDEKIREYQPTARYFGFMPLEVALNNEQPSESAFVSTGGAPIVEP